MTAAVPAWRAALPAAIRPYAEPAPLAALALGVSSGFPFTMIAATLTTRLAQSGIDKKSVTAFALAFLLYNLKFLWAPLVDRAPVPWLSRAVGQRRAWLLAVGSLVIVAVICLGLVDPKTSLGLTVAATLFVAFAGATFDIVIDGYRIELLDKHQLGVGSGMSQYGWRIGSTLAAGLALFLASRIGWNLAYVTCAVFALPAMLAGIVMGEPARAPEPTDPHAPRGLAALRLAVFGPLADFFTRQGAWIVLAFILVHKIGDTLANLTVRLLFNDLKFSNDEIALFDVGTGAVAFLVGIFVGGILYSRFGMKRAVLVSLILMGVSNLSFAALAATGHSVALLGFTMGFENFCSGIGGVAVVAYLSALCNLRFTATQFALLSAAASVLGRFIQGTTTGAMIEHLGFVDFYLLTTAAALPGILIYLYMLRAGLADVSDDDGLETKATL